jgi:hypothetical protein
MKMAATSDRAPEAASTRGLCSALGLKPRAHRSERTGLMASPVGCPRDERRNERSFEADGTRLQLGAELGRANFVSLETLVRTAVAWPKAVEPRM